MVTDTEAWDLVVEKLPMIQTTIRKASSSFVDVQVEELQSYAVEAAFRAVKSWDPKKSPSNISAFIRLAVRRGTIDGLREWGKFYGFTKYRHEHNKPMVVIDLSPFDDIDEWDSILVQDPGVPAVEFLSYLEPLSERYRQAMYLSFVECWTNTEIGRYLGVTNDRVWQIIDKSIKILRNYEDR